MEFFKKKKKDPENTEETVQKSESVQKMKASPSDPEQYDEGDRYMLGIGIVMAILQIMFYIATLYVSSFGADTQTVGDAQSAQFVNSVIYKIFNSYCIGAVGIVFVFCSSLKSALSKSNSDSKL